MFLAEMLKPCSESFKNHHKTSPSCFYVCVWLVAAGGRGGGVNWLSKIPMDIDEYQNF